MDERHRRARAQTVTWLVEAVERGDYYDALEWLGTLAAVDAQFDFSGQHLVSRWQTRAEACRGGAQLPGALSVEGAAADYRGVFGMLLRHSFDGIVLNARESRWILEVSDSFCELSGYARHELIGRTSVELGLVAEDSVRAVAVANADAQIEGLYITKLTRKDGGERWVEFSHQLVGDELVITITRDITRHRSLEQDLDRLQNV